MSATLPSNCLVIIRYPLLPYIASLPYDQPFEEFPVAHELHAIATTTLVPAPEPEQRSHFLSGKAVPDKLVHFRSACLCVCCFCQLFRSLNLCIHCASFLLERSIANSRFREVRRIANASWLVIGFSL